MNRKTALRLVAVVTIIAQVRTRQFIVSQLVAHSSAGSLARSARASAPDSDNLLSRLSTSQLCTRGRHKVKYLIKQTSFKSSDRQSQARTAVLALLTRSMRFERHRDSRKVATDSNRLDSITGKNTREQTSRRKLPYLRR